LDKISRKFFCPEHFLFVFFVFVSLRIENEMILSPVFVCEVVLDGGGQVEVVDLALLDALLVDVLTNHTTAKVHQRKRLS
jgi:hypothetical protein